MIISWLGLWQVHHGWAATCGYWVSICCSNSQSSSTKCTRNISSRIPQSGVSLQLLNLEAVSVGLSVIYWNCRDDNVRVVHHMIHLCFICGLNLNSLISAKYDVESVEDIPVAAKNKMNINFTLNLDERWVSGVLTQRTLLLWRRCLWVSLYSICSC